MIITITPKIKKIAFSWPHGTGKTTIMKELLLILPYQPIREVARKFITRRWINLATCSNNRKTDFQITLFREQWRVEKKHNSFISDRTLYDIVAYTKEVNIDFYNIQLEQLKKNPPDYDVIFYLSPWEFELEDDGVRFTDPAFQRKIHNNLLKIYEMLGIEVVYISGTVQERLEQIIKVLV